MSLERYLRPGRRFLAVAISLAVLGSVGPAWAHPGEDDEAGDGDKKEIRVFRSGGEDEDADDQDKKEIRVIRNWVERADSKGGYLGVQVQNITRSLMKARDLSTDEGALVNRVEDESPADVAGIRMGDVIVEVNREKVADPGDLVEAVRELEPGAKVEVVLLREGLRKTLKVEIAKRPHDMMMGAPGFQWRGEGGMGREKMDGDFKMMTPGPRFHQEMEELRQELDELKAELKELRRELREGARGRSGSRSGS
ncbi:MAG: PDZ domain-containing protein [Candidatus Eisenbacteria bacterium]